MLFCIFILASNIFSVILTTSPSNGEYHRRQKRYLVYPDGGPARTQFILGLGVPVDTKEQTVTVGTVIKFQYDLPTNSSEYTSRIYGFVNTVSRDMDGDTPVNEEDSKNYEGRNIESNRNELNETKTDESGEDEVDNTLVDITFNDRKKRSLAYSEGGMIDTNDLKGSTKVSLQEAIRRQEMRDKYFLDQQEEPKRANRWDFYKIIEHMSERYGFTGRPCLLRTICEAAEVPFTHENGLLGEIGHILFTPSTTKDDLSHHTDNEYHAAERLGMQEGIDCEALFPECEGSVLETFTQIGMDTMHTFGIY